MNKVFLIGRLGKDPIIKTFESGTKLASFTLATTERHKDKDGNKKEVTEWHNCQIWGSLADVAEKYIKKGDLLAVEGKIQTRSYEQDSVKKYVTEIICDKIEMLGGSGNNNKATETTENTVSNNNAVATTEPAYQDDLPF